MSSPNPIGVSKSALADDKSARRLAGDVIEVRRVAANHRADGDERVVALHGEQSPRGDRQLPRAGHPHHVDVVDGGAMPNERVERAVDETLDDFVIESAGHDREPPVLTGRRSGKFSHYDASRCPSLSRFVRRYSAFSSCAGCTIGTRSPRRRP